MAKAVSPRGFARERVLEAALSLFAEHGVKGTSLQMIADRLGVSKAAVYYQFHSKDDIVLAVIQPVFDDMLRLVRIAEAMSTPEARREAAISGMVELAVRHRRVTAVFHGDPVIDTIVHSRAELEATIERLTAILLGPEPDVANRIVISMLASGVYGSATDPELNDVSDEDLHRVLLDCTQRLLRAPITPVVY
ncbi:TetR family transcriptional regulator [Mycolicibacterium mageritense DSM 44476 = CIP 104973]|uniref:TetR family transcriptional regulator n=1 Tax=Mycolicibacterium mageritense TaxID=53462 RepID=A0AAI8TUF7_MYCME|nr:TetR/AcrR family transcriptional regulator [Mycolicibacterium mageritense]MBN3458935.1 TetR/AcrR family transcriptional regulator [Mycobacterium sp. DSM 3803]OKH74806.1 TetR family transcriptional regulator [Mycobacterium sp. SWH-M3]MCC9186102.1 TetR/AcrR family transcriptional regulator [Mycolicibacterium mageritense]TXI65052.1 MAG: TetR/AcrR family transcriptional regulator [Mycolicibacterium mageritense]CDO22725.1 TetR family transcriptional regulator [Mycolicibacterium mageritense DSM 4